MAATGGPVKPARPTCGEFWRPPAVVASNIPVTMPSTRTPRSLAGLAAVWAAALVAVGGAQAPSPFAPLPLHVESPADNPSTPEKVALGKLLFWDPILSGAQDIACATCHHPDHGFTDGRALPIGAGGTGIGPKRTVQGRSLLVKRNSPTILNVAFNGLVDASGPFDPSQAPMFWDSRVRGLEAQTLAPIESLEEMRGDQVAAGGGVAAAVARVAAVRQYRDLFQRAFGESDAVNALNLSRAIAAFERSLVTSDSPFDRYLRGDKSALNATEIYGMEAFDKQGCTLCHKGPMLSDYQVHVLGVPDNPAVGTQDPGAEQRLAFRTPTLRNLAYTAPYMHGGTIDHVDTVVADFYRRPGGRRGVDPLLQRVAVESNAHDITAFLATLNGGFDRSIPPRVPSGLRPGGR
jgi:cytochrome c peroxidase